MRRTKQKAGERKRDEKRPDQTPRMHGRNWHDHPEPRDMSPDTVDLDALPEAESGGEHEGMGKGKSHGSGAGASRK
jgi:hypothetical protein